MLEELVNVGSKRTSVAFLSCQDGTFSMRAAEKHLKADCGKHLVQWSSNRVQHRSQRLWRGAGGHTDVVIFLQIVTFSFVDQ